MVVAINEHCSGRLTIDGDVIADGIFGADASRLAACWNLLDGVPTEDVEAVDALHLVHGYSSTLTMQRELNAARTRIAELDAQLSKRPCQNNRCHDMAAARALLAEVTGCGVETLVADLKELGIDHVSLAGTLARIRAFLK